MVLSTIPIIFLKSFLRGVQMSLFQHSVRLGCVVKNHGNVLGASRELRLFTLRGVRTQGSILFEEW